MRNKHDIFLEELSGHLSTLEKHAKEFSAWDENTKRQYVVAAIYSLRFLFDKHATSTIRQILSGNEAIRERFLAIVKRLYLVLNLMYLPHSTGELKDWIEDILNNLTLYLTSRGWEN
ncbi:MAG: hypothetical protein ABSB25_05740 [Sedimentisphaerales bacterium]|jgi:hypothetical protein